MKKLFELGDWCLDADRREPVIGVDYRSSSAFQAEVCRQLGGTPARLVHRSGLEIPIRCLSVPGSRQGLSVGYGSWGIDGLDARVGPDAVEEYVGGLSRALWSLGLVGLCLRVPAVQTFRVPWVSGIFCHAGVSVCSDPVWTCCIDLQAEEDELFMALDGKLRNQVRRAEKLGCKVSIETGPQSWRLLSEMLVRLEEQKGFATTLGPEFFQRVAENAGAGEYFISVARIDDQPMACGLFANRQNVGTYLLGASDRAYAKVNAPSLLHWRVIQRLRELGVATYDLGGVDWKVNPNVWQFKRRLNGSISASTPMIVLASNGSLRRTLSRLVEWRLRRVRR